MLYSPVTEVEIGELTFSKPEPADPSKEVSYFDAKIETGLLTASVRVDITVEEAVMHPTELFDDMATNWKGWTGEKIWGALEDELVLTCTHDGLGHVNILVEMKDGLYPPDWSVQASTQVEAGQLESIAKTMRRFFRLPNGQPHSIVTSLK